MHFKKLLVFSRLLSLIADKTNSIWNKKLESNIMDVNIIKSSAMVSDRSSSPNAPVSPIQQNIIPPPPPLFPFTSQSLSPVSSENGSGFSFKSSDSGKLVSAASLESSSNLTNRSLLITPSWENIQETAARLLFMAVRWVKCLAPFQTLSLKDQVKVQLKVNILFLKIKWLEKNQSFMFQIIYLFFSFCCCKSLGKICSFCICRNGRFHGTLIHFWCPGKPSYVNPGTLYLLKRK